jgi:hypothetical protein
MIGVAVAARAGERGRRAARYDGELLLFLRDGGDGQRDCGVRHVEREIGAVVVGFARFDRSVGAVVAVVDRFDLDRAAEDFPAEVRDGHLGGLDCARSRQRGVDAAHVGDDGDLDRTAVGGARGRRRKGRAEQRERERCRKRT